jgi:HTH-type transcriptional regulator/antitoxin HigA
VRELAQAGASKIGKFSRDTLDSDLLKYVARLSWMERGPRHAVDFLAERGIMLIIEPQLPGTRVDGAALYGPNGIPVVALTVRHDRLDNFWFTLLHELAHVWKHLDARGHRAIIDEEVEQAKDSEAAEREANDLANEALLPRAAWRRSEAYRNPTTANIKTLSEEQQVHPAIVAGRVRFERRNYSLLAGLVGYRQVRQLFPEIRWS